MNRTLKKTLATIGTVFLCLLCFVAFATAVLFLVGIGVSIHNTFSGGYATAAYALLIVYLASVAVTYTDDKVEGNPWKYAALILLFMGSAFVVIALGLFLGAGVTFVIVRGFSTQPIASTIITMLTLFIGIYIYHDHKS